MSEISLKEIEKELDDISINLLDLMNDNITCKMNIERAVRSGCMDLAKTRYILGNVNSVSTLKVPTENITAGTTVSTQEEDGKVVFELNREAKQKTSENSKNQDPLKWFGVLVPTNLKHGQSWFIKALDYSAQSASISVDINKSLSKYKELMSVKCRVMNKTEDS